LHNLLVKYDNIARNSNPHFLARINLYLNLYLQSYSNSNEHKIINIFYKLLISYENSIYARLLVLTLQFFEYL